MVYFRLLTYIYHTNQVNVGKYTIHGSYGYEYLWNLVSNHCRIANPRNPSVLGSDSNLVTKDCVMTTTPKFLASLPITDPWDWYIFLREWLICMVFI